ncbi:MAG TPA: aldehyde dehydrogenase family protein, partial [Dongiaceae bacterium]|nr:aldehyde dehydrogenase family protein [Dongiaceae bacterium]
MSFDPFAAQIFVAGGYRTAAGANMQDIINPADLSVVGKIALCEARHVSPPLETAQIAQRAWAALDAKSRAAALHRVADAMEANAQGQVAELMTREMGKPYTEAVGELMNVGSIFRYYAEVARDDGGFLAGPTSPGALQYAKYFPYGISAHILPYNFPIILMAFTVAASLAVGNAVVIKPAPATSLCTLKFMAHFASLPPGLVSCLTGGAETAQALIADDRVKVVAFTGSVEAGQKVAAACGERLKPCVIEAGGSDPLIVMDSADPDIAAGAAVTAAFHLSGQVCTATERILVHETVHDAFVDRMVARTRELRVGPGLSNVEIGPLVSESARDKVMRLVEQAVAQGATVACGGKVPAGRNVGWFYEPT